MPNNLGTWGTPGYAIRTIPTAISDQYPGAWNIRSALRGYGNLAYGPYGKGLADVGAAQELDPMSQEYQQEMASGGGAYAQPGAGTQAIGNLFSGAMGTEAKRQSIQNQQTNEALKGIAATGMDLADSIYGQQSAANKLDAAEMEASAQEQKGAMDIANMLTNPQGLGANIMQGFGASPGTTPLSAVTSLGSGGWSSPLGQGAASVGQYIPGLGSLSQMTEAGPSIGDLFSSGFGVGMGADTGMGALQLGDLGSIFSSLGAAGGTAGAAGGAGDLMSMMDLASFAAM